MTDKSGWNWRIIHYKDGGYGLHEVFYDDDGNPEYMTEDPVGFACDEEEGSETIQYDLQQALTDAGSQSVLEETLFLHEVKEA